MMLQNVYMFKRKSMASSKLLESNMVSVSSSMMVFDGEGPKISAAVIFSCLDSQVDRFGWILFKDVVVGVQGL